MRCEHPIKLRDRSPPGPTEMRDGRGREWRDETSTWEILSGKEEWMNAATRRKFYANDHI
jgi:hypothetical protein